MICSANPACPSETGYGNVCNSVSRSYTDGGGATTGMPDIISRCQAANQPDPCGSRYRQSFGGGCAQQCASVARCSAAAAR